MPPIPKRHRASSATRFRLKSNFITNGSVPRASKRHTRPIVSADRNKKSMSITGYIFITHTNSVDLLGCAREFLVFIMQKFRHVLVYKLIDRAIRVDIRPMRFGQNGCRFWNFRVGDFGDGRRKVRESVRFRFCVFSNGGFCFDSVRFSDKLFQPCRASDPELKKCVKAIADRVVERLNDGLPELNIEGFDPYSVDDIHSKDLGNIELHFADNKVYGSRSNRIHYINFDPVGRSIEISLSSTGYMISKYKLNGTLIILPVNGEGLSNLTIGK